VEDKIEKYKLLEQIHCWDSGNATESRV